MSWRLSQLPLNSSLYEAATRELCDEAAWDLSQVDDEAEIECYGKLRTKVVGVRYYDGVVSTREMVMLVREPNNPYDSCAIRVDNVERTKVGHLARDQVMCLAPLCDAGKLQLEGLAVGEKGAFQLPIDLYFFGPPQYKHEVMRRIASAGMYLNSVNLAAGEADVAYLNNGASSSASAALSQAELDRSLHRLFDDVMAKQEVQDAVTPNSEVTSQLYPHQKAALAWMIKRENSGMLPPFWEPRVATKGPGKGDSLVYCNSLSNFVSDTRPAPLRGGILADDMGLGKTLIIISLVATNAPGKTLPRTEHLRINQEEAEESDGEGGSTEGPKQKKQKKEEDAELAITRGKGAGKASKAHPIPTSPSLLGKVAEKEAKAQKAAAKRLAKKEEERQAILQQLAAKYEPPPSPPAASGPRATLIVCPLSVLSQWEQQLEEHTQGNMKVYIYHGPSRKQDRSFLAQHDIVVTTYATMSGDAPGKGVKGVHWLRVVLDEAHIIKNHTAQQSVSACALVADRRWAVTGTPIQNKLQDLFGYTSFLKLEPLTDKSIFTRALERPMKLKDERAVQRLQVLMASIAMRRTKSMKVNGRALVSLPRKVIHVVKVPLTPEDRLKYERLELDCARSITSQIRSGTLLQNYTAVLEVILRLRQICVDGHLCPQHVLKATTRGLDAAAGTEPKGNSHTKLLSAPSPDEMKTLLGHLTTAGEEECPICLEQMSLPVITRCVHLFCRRCIEAVVTRDKALCPLCRSPVTLASLIDRSALETATSTDQAADGAGPVATPQPGLGAAPGAKLSKLLEHLRLRRQQLHKGDDEQEVQNKAVVFSQFTGFLDLIEASLRQEGVKLVRIDGSSSATGRKEALRQFASKDIKSPEVFLVSLKAGGVGINLTAANEVHLMDPWWNCSVEDQAMDRVHRLGQTRDVEVFRYIAEDTIEERMLELQARKLELCQLAFDRRPTAEAARQMRIDDVRLLLSLN
eukprot:gene10643-12322_t